MSSAPPRSPSPSDRPAAFPGGADTAVRLDRAATQVAQLGDWRAQRFLPSGLLTHRAAAWENIEAAIQEANAIADPDSIFIGQELLIPPPEP